MNLAIVAITDAQACIKSYILNNCLFNTMVKKFRLQVLATARVVHMMELSFADREEAEQFVKDAIEDNSFLDWDEYIFPDADSEFHIKEID